MKSLLLSLFLVADNICYSQTKVVKKTTEYLNLRTLDYKIITGHDNTLYYSYTFISGYKYPSISEGYYSHGIFERLDGLVKFYNELANLENQENGFYKLSTAVSGQGSIYADKVSTKVKLYSGENHIFKYTTFKMDDIKADLELLKSLNE